MSSDPPKAGGEHHAHIDIPENHSSAQEDSAGSPGMRNSRGWDGKLRVPKSALITNPEALSDSEYSDDDNVLPGEEINADEGMLAILVSPGKEASIS